MKKDYLRKFFLLLFCLSVSVLTYAQTGSISGQVVDETNQPLPGASVLIPSLNRGTSTDANGNFRLSGIANGTYTLRVSYIGYNDLQPSVTVSGETHISFTLKPNARSLNEVVVIGYGTQKKGDLTGAISTVSAKDFQKGVVTSPEQLIAGKVAGVSIISNGGAPGAGSTIRIRGGASLNASNDPLIVVDGVPLAPTKNVDGTSAIAGVADPLSLINPNDIETFTVLKDASATAIYGSRASNGVILITTKKGQAGKPKINFSTQYSISDAYRTADVLSPSQFRDYVNAHGDAAAQALLGNANTDWQDLVYQRAGTSDNNLTISGAFKNVPYRYSFGHLDQEGVLKTGDLKRNSASLNLSPSLFKDHLKINLNLKGSISNSRFANQDAIYAAANFDPTKPVYSGSNRFGGYYEWLDPQATSGLKSLAPLNPLGLLMQKNDIGKAERSIGNVQLDYKVHFLPDLHVNLNLGYDVSRGIGTVFISDSAAARYNRFKDENGVLHGGQNTQYKQTQQNKLLEFYLNYGRDLKSIDSRLDLVAGYSFQDFLTTNYNYPDVTADGTIVSTPNYPFDKPEHILLSYYGRVNYSLKNRYMLTATVRSDGSSRFNPDNRWATFPSAALAWRISEESFMQDSKTISDLKLRVGYGVTGQQEGIGLYDYISYYNLSSSTAQYQLGDEFYNMYRPNGYYYPRKWEETATTNVGLDYGFLNNRISGSIEYYYKKTTALLNLVSQPAGTNFSNQIVANVGDMKNNGVEFNLSAQAVRSQSVSWDINFNATYNKNEITNLTIAPDSSYVGNKTGSIRGGTGQNIQINSVGYSRSAFFAYQQVYGADGKPLDGIFVDRNGDGIINENDLYHYKSPDPKVFLGLSSTVTYNKWSAGFTARASLGNYVYNNNASSTGTERNILNPLGYLNNGSVDVLESNISGTVNSDKAVLSDYYVQNASFLKIDNINIGYNFGKVFKTTGDLRMSANIQNAFVITKYNGVDPEISGGIDNSIYPRPRTFVLGLNLDF